MSQFRQAVVSDLNVCTRKQVVRSKRLWLLINFFQINHLGVDCVCVYHVGVLTSS
jgi:hypothetical protein